MAKKTYREFIADAAPNGDRAAKMHAFIVEQLTGREGKGQLADFVHSKDVFNSHNSAVLMALEIHECLEAGKFDFVFEDNSHDVRNGGRGCMVFEMPAEAMHEGKKILLLPVNCDYQEWRAVYDELMK